MIHRNKLIKWYKTFELKEAVAIEQVNTLYRKLNKISKALQVTPDDIIKPVLSDSACTNMSNFKELINNRIIRLAKAKNIKINN